MATSGALSRPKATLASVIAATAAWREEMAATYRKDKRHRRASQELRALAGSVSALPEDDPLLTRLERSIRGYGGLRAYLECESKVLSEIGFVRSYQQDALRLINDLIRECASQSMV